MNFEEMLRLIDKVSASSLSSFEYETEELKLSIQCGEKAVLTATPAVSEAEPRETVSGKKEELPEGKLVKSPLVGTFYAAPSQDAAPYVKVGDPVKKGQVLAIVEAMKLMNEIVAEQDGIISEICVGNNQVVDFGRVLFKLRKDAQ